MKLLHFIPSLDFIFELSINNIILKYLQVKTNYNNMTHANLVRTEFFLIMYFIYRRRITTTKFCQYEPCSGVSIVIIVA